MTLPDSSHPNSTPGNENHELPRLLGEAFEEKPIWTGLYEGIRDRLFAPKLPPLELTSTPIPALDRMAVKTNPWAVGTATALNGALLALLLCLGLKSTVPPFTEPV